MDEHEHHQALVDGLYKNQKELFDRSDQAVYAYLDDNHKVCNERFAKLLGYETAEEWAGIKENFTDKMVAPESRDDLIDAYTKAVENFIGSKIDVTWKQKSGELVETTVIFVPILEDHHPFALHFVTWKE